MVARLQGSSPPMKWSNVRYHSLKRIQAHIDSRHGVAIGTVDCKYLVRQETTLENLLYNDDVIHRLKH